MSEGHPSAGQAKIAPNLPKAARDDLPVDPDVPEPAGADVSETGPRPRRGGLVRERWDILLVVGAGGALGSLARWGLGDALPHRPDQVAWSTVIENVSGALLLGVLMVFVLDLWPPSRYARPFLGVGVLGGYTTFSTYMLDTRMLLAGGRVAAAFGFLFGSLLAGLLAAWVGIVLARTAVSLATRRRWRRRRSSARADAETPADAGPSTDGAINPDRDGRSRR